MKKIIFIGAGAIATAMGNVLAKKTDMEVILITIEDEVVKTMSENRVNQKYFPNIALEKTLKSTIDFSVLSQRAIVFIAIPSVVIVDFLVKLDIHPWSILVNLAKGFGNERRTITECISKKLPNPVCTMKGPSFAREIINNQPTAFTVGAADEQLFDVLKEVFHDTTIHLDFSTDVRGVELLSILKNIYAIVVGVVDAQFESPNLKFLVFTKAFKEMRSLLLLFGGQKKTLYNYCGIGDFALTALNDLSRNRTLGLLIGKGFFTDYISEKVVLEGRIATNIFHEELANMKVDPSEYPILNELYQVFNNDYDISRFVGNLLK
jgi:glycerol-3-phosphate dehydrogenase (NAD(P)+)